jgi:hypothetical protein
MKINGHQSGSTKKIPPEEHFRRDFDLKQTKIISR